MKIKLKTETQRIKKGRFSVITDNSKIVKIIYNPSDGLRTNEKLFGLAKCNLEEDIFNFRTGFNIAIKRLDAKISKNREKVIKKNRESIIHNIRVEQRRLIKKLEKKSFI